MSDSDRPQLGGTPIPFGGGGGWHAAWGKKAYQPIAGEMRHEGLDLTYSGR
jgi:hypothetical protein